MLRKFLGFHKKIQIDWSYPKEYKSLLNSRDNSLDNWGLYQIILLDRHGVEHLIYIGKAFNNFRSRLKSHLHKFSSYEGILKVRLGSIINTSMNDIQLQDVEKAIILYTNPLRNSKATYSYNSTDEYLIESFGSRGFVPQLIDTKNL